MKSKFLIIIIIILSINCLKAKKSSFDLNSGNPFMFGFVFLNLNRGGSDTTPPTVTVTNLKSKGVIETGLLFGTASDNVGVTSVEVQINSGVYVAATTSSNSTTTAGTKDWTYKIPVTAKWTYAYTNTVNIRVKDTSGNTTINEMTSVQKGENLDINGDGFVDLIVGAPTFNTNQGRVYVFNGSATGISQTSVGNANQTFTGTLGNKFGSSIAMTDINADGFADLVVCEFAGGAGTHSGYYYLGSSSGFGNRITINQIVNTEYCTALTVGDFNSDGYGDVAISAVSGNGNIYIYNGSANGLVLTPANTLVGSGGSNMGLSLASGDINGDGKTDLVARTSSSPYILSFLSDGNNLVSSTSITNISNTQVALGDFNGDGKADLAVGETGFSANTGRVYVFLSNGTNLNTTAAQTIVGEATSYFFSKKLSVGDVNQDGIADLIAGNWDFGSGGNEFGKVYVFYGCITTGICKGSVNASSADLQITGIPTALQFGSSVKLMDTNRDGFPDLLVGGPGFNSQGALFIYKGTASGISTSFTSNANASQTILGQASSSSNFGLSLY